MAAADNRPRLQSIRFGLFDPLFAVVVGIGFSDGVVNKPFFNDPGLILEPPFDVDFTVLVMAYLLVVLSWVGYHRSTESQPIMTFWRFFADVALLALYLLLLLRYENLAFSLLLLLLIFVAYVVWDALKAIEYPDHGGGREQSRLRRGVSVLGLVYFAGVLLFYQFGDSGDGLFLVLGHVGVIGYRIEKSLLWPGRVLSVLEWTHSALLVVPMSKMSKVIGLPDSDDRG